MDAAGIAKVALTSEDRVRDVIRNFNADGFGSLYPKYKGSRPLSRLDPEIDGCSAHRPRSPSGRSDAAASAGAASASEACLEVGGQRGDRSPVPSLAAAAERRLVISATRLTARFTTWFTTRPRCRPPDRGWTGRPG
jgi:hypothetical protein